MQRNKTIFKDIKKRLHLCKAFLSLSLTIIIVFIFLIWLTFKLLPLASSRLRANADGNYGVMVNITLCGCVDKGSNPFSYQKQTKPLAKKLIEKN
jgi:hypothetical protein